MKATVERAAWLASDVLLLTGSGEGIEEGTAAASARAGERTLDVAAHALVLTANGSDAAGKVLFVSSFSEPLQNGASLELTLGSGDSALSVDSERLSGSITDPLSLLREELKPLSPQARARALSLVWTAAAPRLDQRGSFPLAGLLASAHTELRPTLAAMVMTPDHPNVAHVDTAFEIDPKTFWIEGWMQDRDGTAVRLTLVAPEGGRAELLPNLFRFPRPDIAKYFGDEKGVRGERHGLMVLAKLDGPSFVSGGWLIELETGDGWAAQKVVPEISRDVVEARDRILLSLRRERPGEEELIRTHVHPAIESIQDRLREAVEIETVVQLGEPPASPSVSVIVPLYRSLSFFEYQMADWARDPQLRSADLIYVLDSPHQAEELERLAYGLHSLYAVPFRMAVMKGNAGFAGVNNSAAELARAGKLLLLNSDVVPRARGWLGQLTAFYDSTPNVGALGPKLLFEDDSLQHAGMYFYRSPDAVVWENMHYFKGQHRDFAPANVARPVPAVTGACMLVDRGLYEDIGGLSHRYVQGGYEDSDFCLRVAQGDREHWYLPTVELYHLEDQSYPKDVRERATRYNKWLHTELWGEQIEHVMAQYPGPEG